MLAIVVALLGLLASGLWFGVYRRRLAETEAGIQALASMKWRDCLGLVIEALNREGYKDAPSTKQPGEGGTEFLLLRDNERILLSYKHGTAYRLGEANVRDFANGVQLQGATGGILVTLGTADGVARDNARGFGVQLIDGHALWPKVRQYVPVSLLNQAQAASTAQIKQGLWIGSISSVVLGILIYFLSNGISLPDTADSTTVADATVAHSTGDTAHIAVDPTLAEMSAAAKALDEVAKLTDVQRARRRTAVANEIASIAQVGSAAWSAQSTLLMVLQKSDGKDKALIDDSCRILVQYEELRYTRLQLQPPADSKLPVRWLQCR